MDYVQFNTTAQTKEKQDMVTPSIALELLRLGNERFINNRMLPRDLVEQRNATCSGQFPFATVLSCIDSRVSSELIFDQGIGDIFSIRVAGNVVNQDILGSMEFACKIAKTKLLLVLGHTGCGAVKGACDNVSMGILSSLLSAIRPAVIEVKQPKQPADRTSKNEAFVEKVARKNVENSLAAISSKSQILADLVERRELKIIGGMHDICSGEVKFF